MILEYGAPTELDDRTMRERDTYAFLDALGIDYARVDHAPADTMEICRGIEAVLGAHICKNLFLCNRQQTAFYLLMMPGDKPFRTKELSAQIGSSRLSFATPAHMEEYLGVAPGSVSVLGLINDKEERVRLLIDADLLKNERIGCHPCVNTSTLRLRTTDLLSRFLPSVQHTYCSVHLLGGEEQ